MKSVVVVERPERWPHEVLADAIDGGDVSIVAARAYLADRAWQQVRRLRVVNLCRSTRYQSIGYYVSLLAEARGHRPLPSVETIEDLKSPALVRRTSSDFDALLQRALRGDETPIGGRRGLDIHFGRLTDALKTSAPTDSIQNSDALKTIARRLFALYPAPLLRAELERTADGWQLAGLRSASVRDLDDAHRPALFKALRTHLGARPPRAPARPSWRAELAILVDPQEETPPSDEGALRRFERVGRGLGLRVERIERDDAARLETFDALFLRATTSVDHFTYRLARRAEAAGLTVIDDPRSILRCSNKVYLAEALAQAGVPMPRTLVLQRDDVDRAIEQLGLPLVLKLPDGSFSRAVVKAVDADAARRHAAEYFARSELLIAQEFLPTDYDWRLGVLAGEPLYAARYRMARGHWQIARATGTGKVRYGGVEAVPLDEVPEAVVSAAVRAADLMGDGLYGVDVKDLGPGDGDSDSTGNGNGDSNGDRSDSARAVVVEVNDNPNLDAGCEDAVLGDELYRRILGLLLSRVERSRAPA